MIIIENIKLPVNTDFSNMKAIAARALGVGESNVLSACLHRKSVDARRKDKVHFCVSVKAEVKNEERLILKNKNCRKFTEKPYEWKKAKKFPETPPVVIGFGPAGMFAALCLAKAGLCPLVIERGADVDERTAAVEKFWNGGKLDAASNVQFGEGGAGTFSDGKLNTGIKDPRCREILRQFVHFGAPESILTDAKPHIGTDILKTVVKNIRKEIISLGGSVRFLSHFDGFGTRNGKLTEITVNGKPIKCENLILACGHSARDTFYMLFENGVKMERKPFSVGVRIEHLQNDINRALYGDFAKSSALGAADYKAAVHLENGRGVYTFCMCPGGSVVNASSEEGALAVNGMSESRRDGENANSALLVGVDVSDFEGDSVLAGVELQRKIESAAYVQGGGSVPIDTVGHFLYGQKQELGIVRPTVKPRTVFADFEKIFPGFVTESLKLGIKAFAKKISGFDNPGAVLTAPETRSSSPVRILRDENGVSVIKGIYPAGEGAGYAGGIMSAAADGMKIAEKVLEKYGAEE